MADNNGAESLKKSSEELSGSIKEVKSLLDNLSGDISDKSKIKDLLDKYVSPETKEKEKLFDEIMISIDEVLKNKSDISDNDKTSLEKVKNELAKIKAIFSKELESLKSSIPGVNIEEITVTKNNLNIQTPDKSKFEDPKEYFMALFISWFSPKSGGWMDKTISKFIPFDINDSKMLKFFENNGYGNSENLKNVLKKISDVKYSDFNEKLVEKKELTRSFESIWGKIKGIFDTSFTSEESLVVKKMIEMICLNKTFIEKELGNNKVNATIKDIFEIIFPSSILNIVRGYSMPVENIRYYKYK